MEESGYSCSPASGGCCLSLPETILVLVALTIVVQLGLKLASVICYYLWYLVGIMYGMVVVQDPKKLKANKMPALKAKSSALWGFQDVPRRQQRKESRSPSRRCLHCTLEPLKVTMNLQNEAVPYPMRSRPYVNYPPYLPRYYNYDYESRPRPRRASAPSAYAVARYRDAIAGSSDPIVGGRGGVSPERRSAATGTEMVPRKRTAETQHRHARPGPDTKHPDASPRSRRAAKVYIYPVHPQTPPGSRSSSPERPRRRRRRHGVQATSQEEQSEPEARASRRRTQEAEQQTSGPATLLPHGGSTNVAQGTVQTESPAGKPRYYWSDQVTGADWVYRPVK